MLFSSGLAFIASTREHPASQVARVGDGFSVFVVLLFYFSFCFLFLVFVITVLLRVKGKKRFKQRCDAWRCRVFPAAFKERKGLSKGAARISRAASTAGFSLPRSRQEKFQTKVRRVLAVRRAPCRKRLRLNNLIF